LLLEVEQLTKSFGGLMALNNLSFFIEKGEVVGLIGPNGSGKSTAFNLITGTFPPSSGRVIFRGEDITTLPAHQVAKRGIARTFQLVKPFLHLTTLENVIAGRMYGHKPTANRAQAEAEATEILSFVGLGDKRHLKANGLTVMERKRLELARAMSTQPELLLLDEFMAGLAPTEVHTAIELISQIHTQGITIIFVEHIIKAVVSLCKRVIVLNAGQKIADGLAEDVTTNPAVISAYLGTKYAKNPQH
jgi:branched-chain amino acid transport system ATP-binding protein